MNLFSIVLNALIILGTICSIWGFSQPKDGKTAMQNFKALFRYYTIQSNVFVAVAALVMLVYQFKGGEIPFGVTVFKYFGTALVAVTMTVVMVYLGPVYTYKFQLESWNLYLHLIGPLLAIISLCVLEKNGTLPFIYAVYALIPTFIYGFFYLYMVMKAKKWEDFYCFVTKIKWYVSLAAVGIIAFLLALLVRFLYNIGM
ncbi:MAG: hypothetical protein IJL94_03720 [Erysipelotrichaceae bacterium]|nr:hypothetical protein [Erysipelotrichaceae bacterium]